MKIDEADFQKVADHMCALLLDASVENTGGGIDCIFVRVGNGTELVFGTAGEFWAASVYIDGEFAEMDVWTTCKSTNRNAWSVARQLFRAVESFLIGGVR